jgi:C1A family cysteine protease
MKRLLIIVSSLCLLFLAKSVLIESSETDIKDKILSNFQDGSKKQLFKIYHLLFRKKYELNSEEGVRRYRIFKNTLKFIEETNSKNLSYKLGINKFSDLTDDEFRSQFLSNENIWDFKLEDNITSEAIQNYERNFYERSSYGQVNTINWNESFGPAKDQGSCGSCWAFASVGAIEGNYSKNFGQKLAFAEQQLVDCSTYTNGCRGSDPRQAMKYIQEKGLNYQNEYQYLSGVTTTAGTCKYSQFTPNYVLSGTETTSSKTCSRAVVQGMLAKGPIVVGIDGEGNGVFKSYKTGILDMTCSTANHAVILTGLDTDGSRNYYMGLNSWGDDWGEKGFFKIYLNDSNKSCFIETSAILPQVQQTYVPVPPPPAPECLKLYSQCLLNGSVQETCTTQTDINPIPYSFTIGKFKRVIFFTGSKCTGTFYSLIKSNSCFTNSGINSAIKSLIIVEETLPPTGCIWAYDNYCLSGNKIEICSDISDLSTVAFTNKISSIKFGTGVKSVTGYNSINYKGTSSSTNSDRFSYSGSSLDKNIESIKITIS